ncbi:HD domain-containing phosphohydrolase [Paenarthrobacter sp. PH39-S1]|uniref:HD domain-containing phosphohydrolase n=1 Tax=Paenarthrobacter sp. PH39-S1 TaxID=3046204 RepID=UPI0024BA022B|nr:HD domain-containing phosphohydrolase [Paenarthrobacter sp. PH39-S1]MDJ0355272.1 HD domain-containing phosphohydrolase [Paenarthrobacter sp. PH39-S1]
MTEPPLGSGREDRSPKAAWSAGSVPWDHAAAPRRSEILAALSLAIDLGLGQPMEHMLRASLLGLRIGDRAGVGAAARGRIYYANLLAWIGCHADSFELAALFSDDIGFRADYYMIDAHGLPMLSLMLRRTGSGLPPLQRAGRRSRFAVTANTAVRTLIRSHCTSAGQLANKVGLDESMSGILSNTFERWDGRGLPAGRAGVEIPLEMRITQLADTAEVFLRTGGVDAAVATVRKRRGTQFDPELADLFCAQARELTADLLNIDPWPAALAAAPDDAVLSGQELDSVLRAIGDFADLKSPFTVGHSRAVAALAADTAREYGLQAGEIEVLRRAGWVHDLGRMGVSNGVWDKKSPLSYVDRERLQMYPYLSERILGRVPGMRRVAYVAGAHRERVDGSGYPRGRGGTDLDSSQRILAAADAYQTYLEPRPHRPALTPLEAGTRLRAEAAAGRLEGQAADAVLVAAGQTARRRRLLPCGLTDREAEVLRLLCHGLNNREIADTLYIAPKTARNHVEHIYLKIGAGNRVGAALFALDHGLWDRAAG